MKQFENMTIAQLRKLTEQYERLEKENKILKAKFPTKLKKPSDTAEKVVEEEKKKDFFGNVKQTFKNVGENIKQETDKMDSLLKGLPK